jgi:hypothetical protein
MNTFISKVATDFLGILWYRRNKFLRHSRGTQRFRLEKMIPCTAYMEVPLWKNLDFPTSPNPPLLDANPMPRKRKPPMTGAL